MYEIVVVRYVARKDFSIGRNVVDNIHWFLIGKSYASFKRITTQKDQGHLAVAVTHRASQCLLIPPSYTLATDSCHIAGVTND